ncbi:colanic acid biosynthesis glycosyltransferase WcaL [Opitutaceae bacterium EW11]|nr:colanic acid biosynthesis glycosyltransferase WcaL [Opitutaceae bacterium EW11]
MRQSGAELRLYSLWGGGGEFCGLPVHTFNKWLLLELFWIIPWVGLTRWDVLGELLHGLATRKPPGWLNFWENMLGAGFAGCFYHAFRRNPPTLVHAAWSGAPATAAYLLWRMNGHPYSAAAHAYDIYEHGGDWWLREKLAPAHFVHTSTEMGRATLVEYGVPKEKVRCIRRGLASFPAVKPLRASRQPLRIVCVARLVEKKGLRHQIGIYARLKRDGFPFEARIVGDGPMRADLQRLSEKHGVDGQVTFMGHLPLEGVWEQLSWADVLVHTGVVARSGDRDGLPNVIPEAMAAGVMVVTSPTAATTEAIHDRATGLVADVSDEDAWLQALRTLAHDDCLAEQLRGEARRWVESNFDAHKNAARLFEEFQKAVGA